MKGKGPVDEPRDLSNPKLQDDQSESSGENPSDVSERRTMGGEQASESARVAEGPEEGVCPCNTPPSTIHECIQDTEIIQYGKPDQILLKAGIDSIYLGYVVDEPKEGFYKQIKELKLNAQAVNGSIDIFMTFDIEDPDACMNFKLEPKGRRNYPYLLWNEAYTVMVFGEGKTGFNPRVYVEIRSAWIQEVGDHKARIYIEKLIEAKIGSINKSRSGVSRLDVYADILLDESKFTDEIEKKLRCKSRKTYLVKDAGVLETLYVGEKKAPVQCRMYDKGREREKAWALQEYLNTVNLGAIPEGKKIIRVEFQIRRPFLSEHKLKGTEQLPGSATIAWEYLTTEWLRVVKKKSKTNAAREENEDWWCVVQEAIGHKDFEIYKKDHKKKTHINLKIAINKIVESAAQFLAKAIVSRIPSCSDLPDHEITLQKAFDVWGDTLAMMNFTEDHDVDGDFRKQVKEEIRKLIGNRKVINVREIPE